MKSKELIKSEFKKIKDSKHLADFIIGLVNSNGELDQLEEAEKLSKVLKILMPLMIGYFSYPMIDSAIDIVRDKLGSEPIAIVDAPSEKDEVTMWLKEYCNKYKVPEKVIRKMLNKESMFHTSEKYYDANLVGDHGNTLGPSYGAGQIKISTAKEVYAKKPESDIDPNEITADKLRNDTEFNIRTMCKLVRHFYDTLSLKSPKFKKIKDDNKKWGWAAVAYNSGINKAGSRVDKNKNQTGYGKYVSMKENQSLFKEYINTGQFMTYDNIYNTADIPIKEQLQQLLANLPDEEQLSQFEGNLKTLETTVGAMNFESPSIKINISKMRDDVFTVREKLRNVISTCSQLLRDLNIKKKPSVDINKEQ